HVFALEYRCNGCGRSSSGRGKQRAVGIAATRFSNPSGATAGGVVSFLALLPTGGPPATRKENMPMNTLTGAELIVRLLERQGVRTVVGVHRDVPTPLDGALARSPTIRRVLARHERGAAFIALGMARVSGRPAVCIASSVTEANGLRTALAAAARASIPLICITELPCATMRGGIPETANIQGPGTSTGKHRFRARSAEDLLDIIPSALRSAASGRPGPVLIDVPNAVQTDSVTIGTWPELARRSPAPAIAAETLQQAVELIDAAQRPVLLLGDGVLATQASGLAQRLAEK